MQNELVLVTGANGWLGRRLVRALMEGHPEMVQSRSGGHRVRIFIQPGDNIEDDPLLTQAEKREGDIRDTASIASFVSGAAGATLVHLAGVIHPARGAREFIEVNVQGTRSLTQAGKAGIRRAIVMSSNSAIGASKNPFEVFDEESPYRPYMGYGRSKREMEEWLLAHATDTILPEITIIRAPWFYGPEQPVRQTRFFSMVKSGRFPLVGGGRSRRSMGYVDSLAYGILLAAAAPHAAGRIYWLADERPYPMKEIVDTVREVSSQRFRHEGQSQNTAGSRFHFRYRAGRRLDASERGHL
jgi:nucleoside-diphosphate-sugar epimerase